MEDHRTEAAAKFARNMQTIVDTERRVDECCSKRPGEWHEHEDGSWARFAFCPEAFTVIRGI